MPGTKAQGPICPTSSWRTSRGTSGAKTRQETRAKTIPSAGVPVLCVPTQRMFQAACTFIFQMSLLLHNSLNAFFLGHQLHVEQLAQAHF